MSGEQQALGSIQIYADDFDFAEAKKFLALKGNVNVQIVHDSMYPLWRYGQELTVKREVIENLKPGMPILFWREGIYHPCIVNKVTPENKFSVFFLNKNQDFGDIEAKFLLGKVVSPVLSPWWRTKIWLKDLVKA